MKGFRVEKRFSDTRRSNDMPDYEKYWIGIGDLHGDAGNVRDIPELPGAEGVIISGDLTIRGGAPEARRMLEAVRGVNPKVYAQIGNMDGADVDAFLEEQGVNIHAKGLELAPGVAVIGVGASSPTPFNTPSEYPDTQLGEWLEKAHARAGDYEALLLVAHDPPRNTKADVVGGGSHVGSAAVREFIERVQPDVCLTGHIHESRAEDFLGRTRVVNPGMLSRGGYALVYLHDGRLGAELRRVRGR
jgi:hypothetical protein